MVGGGPNARPGELSLAHNGILFLDEFAEFQRSVLEMIRQPLEDGCVTIPRVHSTLKFPAKIMLVAAMNPCPCGFDGDPERHCRCTPEQVRRYRSRISGPLLDRIDLQVEVSRLPPDSRILKEPRSSCPLLRSCEVTVRATELPLRRPETDD